MSIGVPRHFSFVTPKLLIGYATDHGTEASACALKARYRRVSINKSSIVNLFKFVAYKASL